MHGYRPDVRNMSPFFIAYGPAFKKGIVSEPFDSVDIYPLMCHILGLTPAPNNGSLDKVKHMLEEKIGLFDIQIPFSITAATCKYFSIKNEFHFSDIYGSVNYIGSHAQ